MELVKPAALQVQKERERLGVTPQQLAEALGLHERTIARWEAGEFVAHSVYLSRIAKMKPEDFDGDRDRVTSGSHTMDAGLHMERPGVSKVADDND